MNKFETIEFIRKYLGCITSPSNKNLLRDIFEFEDINLEFCHEINLSKSPIYAFLIKYFFQGLVIKEQSCTIDMNKKAIIDRQDKIKMLIDEE